MAYENKAALKAAVMRRLGRELGEGTDLDLADQDLDAFIANAEAEANRLLRLYDNVCISSASVSAGTEFVPLPTNYAGLTVLKWTDSAGTVTQLRYVDHSTGEDRAAGVQGGTPALYSIISDQFRLIPAPEVAGTLGMFVKERLELTRDSDSNVLLQKNGDIYFNGAVAEGLAHLQDDERSEPYRARFITGIRQQRLSDWHDRSGGQRGEAVEFF